MARITADSTAPEYIHRLVQDINRAISEAPRQALPTYSKTNLPKGYPGLIIVTDATGGQTTAFWNGTNWVRTLDNAVIS